MMRNKNILITGCEGFLGTNLAKRLIENNANIIGLDIKVNRKQTLFNTGDYKRITIVKGSVTSHKTLKDILARYKIEYVFHLAAEAIVERAVKNPLRALSSNIQGTWSVLEACRKSSSVKAIIAASSDKAYGSHGRLAYKEDTPLCGKHPYDVSKSCADLLAHMYAHTYGLPVAITRCGNIYGPGDFNFSRLVPDTIRSVISSKPIIIRSDGKFTRDYIFVEDIVDGYILLAEKLRKNKALAGQAFNFSAECPVAVIDLVKEIYKLTGKSPDYRILNKAKYEIKYQCLSCLKAAKVLGWKAKYDLKQGLIKTIAWYKNYAKQH